MVPQLTSLLIKTTLQVSHLPIAFRRLIGSKEVMIVWKWVRLKAMCGTSMYDYGSLRYVEGMSSVEALRSQASKRVERRAQKYCPRVKSQLAFYAMTRWSPPADHGTAPLCPIAAAKIDKVNRRPMDQAMASRYYGLLCRWRSPRRSQIRRGKAEWWWFIAAIFGMRRPLNRGYWIPQWPFLLHPSMITRS